MKTYSAGSCFNEDVIQSSVISEIKPIDLAKHDGERKHSDKSLFYTIKIREIERPHFVPSPKQERPVTRK